MDTHGMRRLEGRRALVTGAGSGIGRATAQRLAAEGAAVYGVDVNDEGCRETVAAIEAAGGRALAARCDVRRSSECDAVVAAAVDAFGGLDILCNVAGVLLQRPSAKCTDDEWQRVLDVNLTGTFYMCRAALPHLAHARGAIVNLASIAGVQAVPYAAAYCASKGGVLMLTKSLAVECAKSGPRVNCICPGGVATPMTMGYRRDAELDASLSAHIAPRMPTIAQPDEIAALAAYLASDEARFMTGSAVAIDGGQAA